MCPVIADDANGFSWELSENTFMEAGVPHVIAMKVPEPVRGDEYSLYTFYGKGRY